MAAKWTPDSWRSRPIQQQPEWTDLKALEEKLRTGEWSTTWKDQLTIDVPAARFSGTAEALPGTLGLTSYGLRFHEVMRRNSIGVAKVLSTITGALARAAISVILPRSATRSRGLVMVSITTAPVFRMDSFKTSVSCSASRSG